MALRSEEGHARIFSFGPLASNSRIPWPGPLKQPKKSRIPSRPLIQPRISRRNSCDVHVADRRPGRFCPRCRTRARIGCPDACKAVAELAGFQRGAELDPLAIVLAERADSPSGDARGDEIRAYQARIRAGDTRLATLERLGWAFVAEARAAERRLVLRARVALRGRHRRTPTRAPPRVSSCAAMRCTVSIAFAEAEALARSLVAERGSPLDYALAR
jgi:hypothetical protein